MCVCVCLWDPVATGARVLTGSFVTTLTGCVRQYRGNCHLKNERNLCPYKDEGTAGRQTKIDMTSPSYLQLCHFDELTFLISRRWICVCRKPKLWHCENISQTSSLYLRIALQEISPHTESEVMTHERSVPVQNHNLNTPLLQPCTTLLHFFHWKKWKWQMCDKSDHIIHVFVYLNICWGHREINNVWLMKQIQLQMIMIIIVIITIIIISDLIICVLQICCNSI